MERRAPTLAVAALGCAGALLVGGRATAQAAGARAPGRPTRDFVPGPLAVRFRAQRLSRLLELPSAVSAASAASALNGNSNVAYAVPNYIATASAALPNDPGTYPA